VRRLALLNGSFSTVATQRPFRKLLANIGTTPWAAVKPMLAKVERNSRGGEGGDGHIQPFTGPALAS